MDEEGTLLAKRYLMTAGRPIEAVKQGLREIAGEIGETVEIAGVGTTGSGRYMIADYVGADVVKNEITAQATAAISIDPSVDTIFEIGGQDSKYHFTAGRHHRRFRDEQGLCRRDGLVPGRTGGEAADISQGGIRRRFPLSSRKPCRLGERCTVFMERLPHGQPPEGADREISWQGWPTRSCRTISTGLWRVNAWANRIFFQGGVAFNKAVVAAFEKYLGTHITVPPNHDVTGAIGMAIIARESMSGRSGRRTMFKGFDLSSGLMRSAPSSARGCPNVCEINRVKVEGDDGFLFYGGRCEKYDVRKAQQSDLPDLFSFREEMLWKRHLADREARPEGTAKPLGVIGVPYIFFMHDFLPFWSAFLSELGFEVVFSPRTNKQIVNLGLENVLSESLLSRQSGPRSHPVSQGEGHYEALHTQLHQY
ncbi:MAG: acyl-CoA dehydratase activase-related protein [Desulfobacterales bacterium]|nr:acyl-CoA dehydratase activase-related protein [Desulfobacterales bacterium]